MPSDIIGDAEARYRSGHYAAAVALLTPLANQAQPAVAALRLLGLCQLRMGAGFLALELMARAYALAPEDAWVNLHYGIVLQVAGRHAEAVRLFEAAHRRLPADPAPLLNWSTSLLALGDLAGAVRAARKGRLRATNTPESHYVLGTAYLAADSINQAKEEFRLATVLAPGFAEAWLNYGVACYRAGEIERAKHAMYAALQTEPGHPAATANLAVFLRLSGDTDAAEALLQEAIQVVPQSAPARINLAGDLLREDRAAEALNVLGAAVPSNTPMRQHWLLQRCLALLKLDRLPEARAALVDLGTVPAALASLLHWRHVLLALAENDPAQAEKRAATMEAALANTPSALPEHCIIGHFDLAKFWSQQGAPDRAFPHWVDGHRRLSQFQPFSREVYTAFADATIEAFSAERFANGPRAKNHDPAPVFIVGMPRSGTTLIEQILDAHADVFGAGERMALAEIFHQIGGASETADAARRVATLDSTALDESAERYLAALHALDPAAACIVDKMPGNFRYLGLVALMLPGARIIACERDVRDIGLSIFTYRFYGMHAYAHDLSDLGWYIGQQRRLMAHWRKVIPNPIFVVRLEDWVHDFDRTLRRVLDFLDLPFDPNCEQFHRLERRVRTVSRVQVREKVNARGLGRWRDYEHHLQPLITALRQSGALDGVES